MRYPNGLVTDKPVVGLDWSRSVVDLYDPKSKHTQQFANFVEAAEAHPNHVFILEATGESFQLQLRQTVLDAFAKYNIDAYCYKTQETEKYRRKYNLSKDEDARVIYLIGTTTSLTLHRFQALVESDPVRDKISDFLIQDRYLYDNRKTAVFAETFLKGQSNPMFFSGKEYRAAIGRLIAAATLVRESGRGFREFRRQIGNYGNGYASILRSEFYHWWVGSITRSRFKERYQYDGKMADLTPKQKQLYAEVRKETMKEADKLIKQLWRLTSEHNTSHSNVSVKVLAD